MKKGDEKSKGSLLWRIIFGILFLIFALVSFLRLNFLAAFLYIIVSIFVFIPGRVFKIHKKWIKIVIVVVAVFGIGLVNMLFLNPTVPIYKEYGLGQEFVLPSDPNYTMMITKAVEEQIIMVGEQEYTTDGVFLLIYAKVTNAEDFTITPFIGLIDSENNEYEPAPYNISEMPQAQLLGKGEIFYLYNILNDSTGLKFSLTDENMLNVAVVDLEI